MKGASSLPGSGHYFAYTLLTQSDEHTKSIEEAAAEKGISEMRPTATESKVPLRAADFSTLSEALDYAAQGETGCNFYSDRGQLSAVLSYADLRHQKPPIMPCFLLLRG